MAQHTPTAAPAAVRFGVRALLGWAALLLGGVPFLLLWLLVQRSWSPLAGLDGEVAAQLNEAVSGSPPLVEVLRWVTDLGGTASAVLVMVLATVFLLIRGQRRLAAFVAVAGIGLAVLGPVAKAVVDRARPVVESPVVQTPSNASFPSGHAMTAVVVYGALLLVALPAVRRRTRPWLVAGTAVLVVLIGATRLALGVHFVSDVLAGWALGAGWLAVTAAAFRGWQHDTGRRTDEPLDPLDVPPAEAPHLAPSADPALPGGRATALRLPAVAAGLFAVATVLGLLVTAVLTHTWLGRLDRSVVQWFVEQRSPGLTTVMEGVGTLSGTRTVIAVGLALAVLGLALTASWRPVVFVVATLVGEVVLYFSVSRVVSRARPAVADLTGGLPSEASWPSGHATAAAALYGSLAALVVVYARARWRWWVLAVPVVLAPAIGISRVYVAAHYPTDVLIGVALGAVWVWACARWLLPPPGRGVRAGTAGGRTRLRTGDGVRLHVGVGGDPPADAVRRVTDAWTHTPAAVTAADPPGSAGRDRRSAGGALRAVPALVPSGADGATIPPSAVARLARRIGPHARLLTVPGAVHGEPLSRPGVAPPALLDLLARARTRDGGRRPS